MTIEDTHTVVLPSDLPPGSYRLAVGLYDLATGDRLPLQDGGDAVTLTEIQVP
jgi:hypothetical protein